MTIGEIRFTPADDGRDLLGFVTFVVGGWLRVDGATLPRRTGRGVRIRYPARQDARGGQHYYYFPITDEARREVERQVLAAIAERDHRAIAP